MTDVWAACGSRAEPVPYSGEVLRMVESQEQVATQRLVGNLGEQDLLESLLERSKPPRPAATAGLDYLLATPFRYPPLRYGSRFGRRHEPALFYAACARPSLLAEAAYYRFVFWQGMKSPPPRMLRTQHTLFGSRVRARRAYRLRRLITPAAPLEETQAGHGFQRAMHRDWHPKDQQHERHCFSKRSHAHDSISRNKTLNP